MGDPPEGESTKLPPGLPADPETTFDSIRGARVPLGDLPETMSPSMWIGSRTEAEGAEDAAVAPPAFEFIGKIGKGGFGEVWEAVQTSLNRTVAVKVMRVDRAADGDPAEDREMFRQEAFTTAALDHPNIVPVYDFGRDENNAPMMAMKLVRGEMWNTELRKDFAVMPAEDFLAKHLPVLADVAQAVVFAHDAGIVHRDLKPSQVMIGDYGEVLLCDWGLAVAADGSSNAVAGNDARRIAPSVADASSPAGTPAYMAPEQTFSDARLVGKWTDIYLLGGILYHLLTGTRPHEAKDSSAAFLHANAGKFEPPAERAPGRAMPPELVELAKHSMQRQPGDRPASAREFQSRLQEHLSGAARRRESRELTQQVLDAMNPIPLDYAILNSLVNKIARARMLWAENREAESARAKLLAQQSRVAIAEGDLRLAELTIDRLDAGAERDTLSRELVAARTARARRERERRVLRFSTAALIAALGIGGTLFTLEVRAQRDRAQLARSRSEDLLGFMIGDLRDKLRDVGRLDILDGVGTKATEYFASIPPEEEDSISRRQRLKSMLQLAMVADDRGERTKALAAAKAIAAEIIEARKRWPEDVDWAILDSDVSFAIASALARSGDLAGAESEYLHSIESARRAAALAPDSTVAKAAPYTSIRGYARNLQEKGKLEESLAAQRKLLEEVDAALLISKDRPRLLLERSISLSDISELERDMGKLEESIETAKLSLAVKEQLVELDPKNNTYKRELAIVCLETADRYATLNRYEEGLPYRRRALELLFALSELEPSNTEWQRAYAYALSTLGGYHESKKEVPEALDYFEKAIAIIRRICALDPEAIEDQRNLAILSTRIGLIYFNADREDEAEPHQRLAIETMQGLIRRASENLGWKSECSVMRIRLAKVLSAQNRFPEAKQELNETDAILQEVIAASPEELTTKEYRVDGLRTLANIFMEESNYAEAAVAFEAARVIQLELVAAAPAKRQWRRTIMAINSHLVEALERLPDLERARPLADEALDIAIEVLSTQPVGNIFRSDVVLTTRRVVRLALARGDIATARSAVIRGQKRLMLARPRTSPNLPPNATPAHGC